METELAFLAGIVVLAIASQWLAWRIKLPAILVLLLAGFAAGRFAVGQGMPFHEVIEDSLLFPIVSLSVAVILFEGGMSLRIGDLSATRGVVPRLVTIGAAVTWVSSSVLIAMLFDFGPWMAAMSGAILVVTGPTVIVPLLQHVRPTRRLGAIAKWEGIVIDPIGAVLAVLVFEAVLAHSVEEAALRTALNLATTLVIGGLGGVLGALVVIQLLNRRWIPDFLDNSVLLAIVFLAYTTSNLLQSESGLVTVTILGAVLANQQRVSVHHLIEFKENLRTILVSILFILLAARVEWQQMVSVGVPGLILLAALVFLVRPLSVLLATWGTALDWREKTFLCCMAPRGVVAAAVSSVFALKIISASGSGEVRIDEATQRLQQQAGQMVSLTYLVIVGTVAIYGLAARPLARKLGLANPSPQGILFAGASPVVRAIAKALHELEFDVLLVDRNRDNVRIARMAGIPVLQANILSEYVRVRHDFAGIGRMLAMTPNDEVNALAALQYARFFGRSNVFQLPSEAADTVQDEAGSSHLRGQLLFGRDATFARLAQEFARGAVLKSTELTEQFGAEEFFNRYGSTAIILFVIDENEKLRIITTNSERKFHPGQTLISLVHLPEEAE